MRRGPWRLSQQRGQEARKGRGCVKLMWLWAEDSEGEKEKRARHDDRLLLKRRWGRQGRGGGPGCGAAWKSNGAKRGGPGFSDMDWHGTNVAAPADRQGRATPGPGGSDWVWEGARASGVARCRALTDGPRPQCWVVALANRRARAAQCRATWIQTGFKNISNRFKILQTLSDPKGVFPCSKNQK
jgi:hypothetical protein